MESTKVEIGYMDQTIFKTMPYAISTKVEIGYMDQTFLNGGVQFSSTKVEIGYMDQTNSFLWQARDLQKQKLDIWIRREPLVLLQSNLQKQKLDIWIRLSLKEIIIQIYKSRNWIYGLDQVLVILISIIYKSRNWIYGLDELVIQKQATIYKSRNWIYGLDECMIFIMTLNLQKQKLDIWIRRRKWLEYKPKMQVANFLILRLCLKNQAISAFYFYKDLGFAYQSNLYTATSTFEFTKDFKILLNF